MFIATIQSFTDTPLIKINYSCSPSPRFVYTLQYQDEITDDVIF